MTIAKRTLSIVAVFVPFAAIAGAFTGATILSVSGLEIRDREGRIRLKTVDGGDGAFSLVMLGADGRDALTLGCSATGERSLVLSDERGKPGLYVGQSKEGGWVVSLGEGDSPCVVLKSGRQSGLEIVASDAPQSGMHLRVDPAGKPHITMGARGEAGGDGLYIGSGAEGNSWCMTAKSGSLVAGMQAAESGAQVILTGGEKGAWMICSPKSADMGVGLRAGASSGARLYATAERHGLLLEDGGRKTSGIVGTPNGGGVMWLGSQLEGLPDTKSPGLYATWQKDSGAAMLLRHSAKAPSVVIQDIENVASGLSVGEGTKGSARVGVRGDASGGIVVRASNGEVLLEVPNQARKQ